MTYMLSLADGERIGIDGFGTPLYAVATFASKADALAAWDKLTPEALEEITISEADSGNIVAAFRDVVLDAVSFNDAGEGMLMAQFHMHGEAVGDSTVEDADYIEAAKILLGEVE